MRVRQTGMDLRQKRRFSGLARREAFNPCEAGHETARPSPPRFPRETFFLPDFLVAAPRVATQVATLRFTSALMIGPALVPPPFWHWVIQICL